MCYDLCELRRGGKQVMESDDVIRCGNTVRCHVL